MKLLVLVLGICLASYQGAFAADNGFSARKIRSGDNVLSLLKHYGFSQNDREEVLRASPALTQLLLTTDMSYLVDQNRDRTTLKIFDGQADRAFVLSKKDGRVGVDVQNDCFRTVLAHQEGEIHGSILASLMAAVPSNWIATRFMDAYLLEHDLTSLPAGARFSLTVEKKFDGNRFVRYGEVTQTGLEINGVMVKKDFMRVGRGGVFVTAKDLLSERPFYAPVNYLHIASLFQPHRRHPITHKVKPHMGIDFEVPYGEPIYAPKKGLVVRMGHNRAAGNYLVLLHSDGIETLYDHLRRAAPGIHIGRTVQTGQTIAEAGSTGYSTRPHLHFAVKVRGKMVNPARYLKAYPFSYEESLQERVAQK